MDFVLLGVASHFFNLISQSLNNCLHNEFHASQGYIVETTVGRVTFKVLPSGAYYPKHLQLFSTGLFAVRVLDLYVVLVINL